MFGKFQKTTEFALRNKGGVAKRIFFQYQCAFFLKMLGKIKNYRNFVPRFSERPYFVHNLFKINTINHEKG